MPMKTEYVTVNSIPVRVDCWGSHTPSDVEKNPSSKPEEVILVIPGNPGVTSFYHEFLTHLHEKTKRCIWIVSHGGHDKDAKNAPPLKGNEELYNLSGQVEQKKQFIEKYLKNIKLICIGHSIGCKMILDVLNNVESSANIEKCYLLFPTIERMAETQNGKKFLFFHNYLLWLILFSSYVFSILPRFLQVIAVKCYFFLLGVSNSVIESVLDLIHQDVIASSFFLANDELKKVRELDHVTLSNFSKKVKLYYGMSDDWAPLTYYEELKKKHENIDAEVCSKGFDHAFVLKDSIPMADLLSEWIITN